MKITAYDNALAELILDRMAEGESVASICASAGYPERKIVRRWLATVPEFYAKFMAARDLQAESLQDQMIEIETRVLSGDLEAKQAKAALDSLQFRIQRLCPKRWGNKVEVARAPGELRRLSDEELERVITSAASGADLESPSPRASRTH